MCNFIRITAYSFTLCAYRIFHLPRCVGEWAVSEMLKLGEEEIEVDV